MSDEQQHRENVEAFKKIKEMQNVFNSLGILIATNLYLSVKQGEMPEGKEHARKVVGIHIGQLTTFLADCKLAALQDNTEELIKIIEDWKEAL